MKVDGAPAALGVGVFRRGLLLYRKETGLTLMVWSMVALLNLITQIVFRHELQPGEFGTLNTALGMLGLMTVPLVAVSQGFAYNMARPVAEGDGVSLCSSALLVTETFSWIWAGCSLVLMFLLLPLLDLPRFSLQLFTLLNVLIAIGGLLSQSVCRNGNQFRLWAWLFGAAVLVRVVTGTILAGQEPWAESGLAAFLFAGFVTLIPALRFRETDVAARIKACQSVWNRDFLLGVGATFSVLLGIFLFVSADRIVAQSWFGTANNNNMGLVNWPLFDAYQTAGLLGRGILWGTQPLLWIFFAERICLQRTTASSLTFFWIYLGTLVAGALVLGFLAQPLSRIFCGADYQSTAVFVPSFAAVMVPLGLLQGVGIFALASRRLPECFVLGGCGVAYALLLYLAGRQPQLMPAYMFGGGLVSLMVVLFVGVVRWGRRQP